MKGGEKGNFSGNQANLIHDNLKPWGGKSYEEVFYGIVSSGSVHGNSDANKDKVELKLGVLKLAHGFKYTTIKL